MFGKKKITAQYVQGGPTFMAAEAGFW